MSYADWEAFYNATMGGTAGGVPPPPPSCPGGGYPTWTGSGWVCGSVSTKSKAAPKGGLNELRDAESELKMGNCNCNTPGAQSFFIPGIPPAAMVADAGPCNAYRPWLSAGEVSTARGVGLCRSGCNPNAPTGVIAHPFSITIPAATSSVQTLNSPYHCNLIAVIVTAVSGVAIGDVTLHEWKSNTFDRGYPKFGTGTTFPDPFAVPVPVAEYNASAILNAQNPLPRWVSAFDLEGTNDNLTSTWTNNDALNVATVFGYLVINYGIAPHVGEG